MSHRVERIKSQLSHEYNDSFLQSTSSIHKNRLIEERKNCSIQVEELTDFLNGGRENTEFKVSFIALIDLMEGYEMDIGL